MQPTPEMVQIVGSALMAGVRHDAELVAYLTDDAGAADIASTFVGTELGINIWFRPSRCEALAHEYVGCTVLDDTLAHAGQEIGYMVMAPVDKDFTWMVVRYDSWVDWTLVHPWSGELL